MMASVCGMERGPLEEEDTPLVAVEEGLGAKARPLNREQPQSAVCELVREAAMGSVGRSWVLLTGFITFYIIYLLFGALVFSTIERPEEERLRRELDVLKQEFLNQSCASAAALDLFLVQVLHAHRSGVSALHNTSQASNWDLTSSMFYANTLVTTVGYGHSTPLSDLGKGFSVLYALLGVPFTMLVLTACVQKLLFPLVVGPVGLLHCWGLEARAACALHLLLLLLLLVFCFFVGPAALFSWLEGSWSFLDGVYFCFISLCTIGLGDYVPGLQPGQKNKPLYQVFVMVYLFLGLMMMFLLLRAVHKMADVHGLTALLQLPRCEESGPDDEQRPIVKQQAQEGSEPRDKSPSPSHASYNTILKG